MKCIEMLPPSFMSHSTYKCNEMSLRQLNSAGVFERPLLSHSVNANIYKISNVIGAIGSYAKTKSLRHLLDVRPKPVEEFLFCHARDFIRCEVEIARQSPAIGAIQMEALGKWT
jgi:hypothetical protein